MDRFWGKREYAETSKHAHMNASEHASNISAYVCQVYAEYSKVTEEQLLVGLLRILPHQPIFIDPPLQRTNALELAPCGDFCKLDENFEKLIGLPEQTENGTHVVTNRAKFVRDIAHYVTHLMREYDHVRQEDIGNLLISKMPNSKWVVEATVLNY